MKKRVTKVIAAASMAALTALQCTVTVFADVPAGTDENVPAVTEVTVPDVTEPDITEPDVTEPDVTEPDVTEPDVTEPDETETVETTDDTAQTGKSAEDIMAEDSNMVLPDVGVEGIYTDDDDMAAIREMIDKDSVQQSGKCLQRSAFFQPDLHISVHRLRFLRFQQHLQLTS